MWVESSLMLQLPSHYAPPLFLPDGHSQTIWPSFFRKVRWEVQPVEMLIPTADGDLLWADYYAHPAAKGMAVLCHGLEGNSRRPYMLGMAKALFEDNFSVLAWNYRGCGGRLNRTPLFYHSGATGDLAQVLAQLPGDGNLPVLLVGFSLGGNLVLRYLGEQGEAAPARIAAAAAISVPLMLADGADFLMQGLSKLYTRNFLKSLRRKIMEKAPLFPGHYRTHLLPHIQSLRHFDEHFTAPIHGYAGADDYYARASAAFVLEAIARPVLLLQAQNDPFLPPSCFPQPANQLVHRVYSLQGGHVGFPQRHKASSFAEDQVLHFWEKLCITCSNRSTESP